MILAKPKTPAPVYTETFKLSQLFLDQDNYRLGHVTTQRDAITHMIDDQKQKLVRLARDLMEVGASPGETIWVTKHPKERGQYIVLEGNRRVTALKLMETPNLANGTLVEKHFKNLGKLYEKKPIRDLEAKVFASREDAQPWIRRRHMTAASGVGLQGWKPLAKARADKAHGLGTPRFLAVIELLGDETDAWDEIYGALDTRWTTVDRVLEAAAIKDVLGITFDLKNRAVRFGNGNTAAGKRVLWRILAKMASADFQFSDVEKSGDRETFVEQFADGSVKAKEKTKAAPAPSPPPPTKPARPIIPIIPRSKPSEGTRGTLAPRHGTRVFRADGARLAMIYKECQGINLRKNPNGAALLLRVFIELSSEAVLAKRSVPIPKKYRDRGKTKWSDIGIALDVKISLVADYFDPTKADKDFQQARLALSATAGPSVFSVQTLHGYFHNLALMPDPASLRGAWDAWEGYLRISHGELRKP